MKRKKKKSLCAIAYCCQEPCKKSHVSSLKVPPGFHILFLLLLQTLSRFVFCIQIYLHEPQGCIVVNVVSGGSNVSESWLCGEECFKCVCCFEISNDVVMGDEIVCAAGLFQEIGMRWMMKCCCDIKARGGRSYLCARRTMYTLMDRWISL